MENEKELLIFVLYLNVGSHSPATGRALVDEQRYILGKTFKDIESKTNYLIKFFIFGVKEETRLECVFPKNQEEIDLDDLFNNEEYGKVYGT